MELRKLDFKGARLFLESFDKRLFALKDGSVHLIALETMFS